MSEGPRVWIDQKLCTGDGLCTQYAPGVFEFGDASLAYVKDAPDQLLTEHGAQADVPGKWRLDVIGAAGESLPPTPQQHRRSDCSVYGGRTPEAEGCHALVPG